MSVFYKTAGGQNAFTVEELVGDYQVTYPLGAAEPTALVITAPYMQLRANYARPNVNAVLSYGGSNAYFIDDEGFADSTGGVVTWQRKWATVPASWSDHEQYAYTFPGMGVTSFGGPYNVTNISDAPNVTNQHDIWSTLPGFGTSWNVGAAVTVAVRYVRNNLETYRTFYAAATSAGTNAYVRVANMFDGSGNFSNISGQIMLGAPGRGAPQTIIVGSRIKHDYALTTDSNIDSDLPILFEFNAVDSTGTRANLLSTGAATVPNVATYSNLVISGIEIVAEPSSRGRYLGNIYERTTRFVKAK